MKTTQNSRARKTPSTIDAAKGLGYPTKVLIRPKNHWMALALAAFYILIGVLTLLLKPDHFMAPVYFGAAVLLLVMWSTTFSTLRGGLLITRILLIPSRILPVGEIETVRPHKRNANWGYGTVVEILSRAGTKLVFQPNRPQPFLTLLREQAPQAKFLL